MKRIIPIFVSLKRNILHILLVIVSLNAAGLQQVYRLPVLVSHFFEHYRINGNADVLDFLAEHYSGDQPTHSDSTHEQLPFKKQLDESVNLVFYAGNADVFRIFPRVSSLIISFYPSFLYSVPAGSLFRPPCVA